MFLFFWKMILAIRKWHLIFHIFSIWNNWEIYGKCKHLCFLIWPFIKFDKKFIMMATNSAILSFNLYAKIITNWLIFSVSSTFLGKILPWNCWGPFLVQNKYDLNLIALQHEMTLRTSQTWQKTSRPALNSMPKSEIFHENYRSI